MEPLHTKSVSQTTTFLRPEELLRAAGIHEGMNVTHFGCGPGFFLAAAARLVGENGRVVGIDIRAQAVEEATRRSVIDHGDTIDVIRGDITEKNGSQLPDAWADLILMMNILHQSDHRKVFTEAARVVRPETGRVLAVEWDSSNIPFGPPSGQRVEPESLLESAHLARLISVRRFKPSQYHYAILFTKRNVS